MVLKPLETNELNKIRAKRKPAFLFIFLLCLEFLPQWVTNIQACFFSYVTFSYLP